VFNILRRINRLFREIARGQRGFTAIQTAIVLAAAVTSAGALTTAVLAGGTEASQEASRDMYAALEGLQGAFMIKGNLHGLSMTTGPEASISQIIFNVALVMEEGAVDFTPPSPSLENNGLAGPGGQNLIVLSYSDEYQHIEELYWTVKPLGKDDGDLILEGGEMFQITIGGKLTPGVDGGNLIDALEPDLTKNRFFNIGIGLPQGVFMYLDGRTPAFIDRVNLIR
jgi:hypothetical protein